VPGAACCLVRDDAGQLYLLGCHHVFRLSLRVQGCALMLGARIFRNDGRDIGPVVAETPLVTKGSGYGLDAALARVDHRGRVSSVFHGFEPRRVVSGPVEMEEIDRAYTLLTPHGTLPALFKTIISKFELNYLQCGAVVRIERAYVFVLTGRTTQDGDSGSAVVAKDGTLAGMHFYRTTAGFALAIPADLLFEPQRFGRRLQLVTGHDP
jgi:hypothetical protein